MTKSSTVEARSGEMAATPVDDTNQNSPQDRLTKMIVKASALYGQKDYSAAAELYSEATELQAEINGEMDTDNADLLYAYGRCLFYVAQMTSTVLGGTAAQAQLSENTKNKKPKKRKLNGAQKESIQAGQSSSSKNNIETLSAADVAATSDVREEAQDSGADNKPLFQITGDENWTDSEDDEVEEAEDDNQDDEDDDFATSYELLDLARILFLRKLDDVQESTAEQADKGKYVASIDLTPSVREIKSRVADIYDLQAEISLEGEKFDVAVTDLKSCLALKEELDPPESSLLAECHYKLSLALECAAQDQQRDAKGNPVGKIMINWDVRNEAVLQQEKAIDCCKLRVEKETKALDDVAAGTKRDDAMAQIEDVQDMIKEMEDRLADLRKPPVDVKAATEDDMTKEMMKGVLGQIMGAGGSSKEEQKEQLAKVMAGANDLSGMVKRKKPKNQAGTTIDDETASNASGTGSKRKVEFMDSVEDGSGKRTKTGESPES